MNACIVIRTKHCLRMDMLVLYVTIQPGMNSEQPGLLCSKPLAQTIFGKCPTIDPQPRGTISNLFR
jgi:hypothetical protein